jgi:hypothetical protein
MIKFVITKSDVSNEFECSLDESILSLKNKIIQEFNLQCKYVDIDFQLERPIRSLGKFNLESGILPRPLDTYTFDRYGLDGRTVTATFHEIVDYEPKKYDRKFKHVNIAQKYKQGGVGLSVTEEKGFDITSETDFPALGS